MSSTVEKRPCPVASAPTPKKHKVSASFSDMYAATKATTKPAVVTQTGLAIKPHARSIVEGGQSTLDANMPTHAARARQLEEASAVSSSPQVVQTSTKPVAKGQTFTEILSLNALQYLCKLKYSDFLKVFPQPEMDKIGTCSPVEF